MFDEFEQFEQSVGSVEVRVSVGMREVRGTNAAAPTSSRTATTEVLRFCLA